MSRPFQAAATMLLPGEVTATAWLPTCDVVSARQCSYAVSLACTYRVRALSGGDDVTARQPDCGRDFASYEHGRRGLKRRAEWAWLLVMQIYSLNIKRRVS